MHCYHTTTTRNAEKILKDGFLDAIGGWGMTTERQGVWVADTPQDILDGVDGDKVLRLEIPVDVLEPYELIEEKTQHREFCVPAEILNSYGPPEVYEDGHGLGPPPPPELLDKYRITTPNLRMLPFDTSEEWLQAEAVASGYPKAHIWEDGKNRKVALSVPDSDLLCDWNANSIWIIRKFADGRMRVSYPTLSRNDNPARRRKDMTASQIVQAFISGEIVPHGVASD